MEKEKILEILEHHPITMELIARAETELNEKRNAAIANRLDLTKNLSREIESWAGVLDKKKAIMEKAQQAAKAAQTEYETTVLDKRRAIAAIEHQINRAERFLRENADPRIESFINGLTTIERIVKQKTSAVTPFVQQEKNIFTDQITETVTGPWEHARKVLEWVRAARAEVNEAHLKSTEELDDLFIRIRSLMPTELNLDGHGDVELSDSTTSRVIGKINEADLPVYRKKVQKYPSWFDVSKQNENAKHG